MIELTEELSLDADKYQFILKEKRVAGVEAKIPGAVTWESLGYYPTLRLLSDALFERRMYSATSSVQTLRELQSEAKHAAKDIEGCLTKAAVMLNGNTSSTGEG
jgi:hypothetical protein